MKKTNAMRILEGLKIPYETLSYDDDGEHKLELGAAGRTAEKLGIEPSACFKTIVMQSETKEVFVFCQNALNQINLKKARNAARVKELNPVKPDDLLKITGYVRGGCSPIGMKKKFPVFIDSSALEKDHIYVSAGIRGEQIKITPQDLIKACNAEAVDLVL